MKKLIFAVSLIALSVSAFAGEKIVEYALPEIKAELVESVAWPGKYMIDAEGLLQPDGPLGSPMLPYKTLTFAVPEGYAFDGVKVEADWEILSEKVKILPVQKPVPVSENPEKPEYVESTAEATYPESIAVGRTTKITGLDVVIVSVTPFRYCEKARLLEKAKNLKLSVIFTKKPRLMSSFSTPTTTTTTSPLVHPDILASTLSTLVNPDDAAPQAETLMAAAAGTQVDYLMVAPPDLYETWKWYIGERKKNHPTLTFEIINTRDIYNNYPYGTSTYRNAAESIHAWLTNYAGQHALKNVVLAGSWYDVTADNSVKHYLQDGTEITLDNAIPSICAEPLGGRVPTDLFYACVTRGEENSGYPWDPREAGHYLSRFGNDPVNNPAQNDVEKCNVYPDFAVSRMTMKPATVNGVTMNQHQIISNYLHKVNRAEAPDFAGNFKMALASSPLTYGSHNMSDGLMYREELEFYDNIPNMYDPNHGPDFRDVGPITRRHAKDIMAKYRPIVDAIGFHEPDIVSHNSSKSTFYNDLYNYDHETGSNNGHGWAGGSSMFNANQLMTQPGLTKINIVGISCETGYLDIYGNQNGKSVANVCLGDAGMANITETGGAIASMNNTRVGLCAFETRNLKGGGDGLSYLTHYYMCDNVAQGMCAGEAWMKMCISYANDQQNAIIRPGQKHFNGENLYPLVISMLFGDPLIKVAESSDYTWAGGNSGVWDMEAESWTKNGASSKFYHANNITFNTAATVTLNPNKTMNDIVPTALPYGGMTMNITQGSGDTFSLSGEGWLRLMKDINVSGGTLKLGISGGVGGAIKFANSGALVLNNNNPGKKYFYIGGLEKVSSVAFQGGGAILDMSGVDNNLTALTFSGTDSSTSSDNVIRTNNQKTKGELVKFLPLTLDNIGLTLETYEAFYGYTGETIATLNNSVLTFRQNRWRGLAESLETVNKRIVLNDSTLAVDATSDFYLNAASMDMSGNSGLLTTHGGKFNLIGTTTINLINGAVCRLDAAFNAGTDGKLVFTGSGRVIVGNADGLDGTIRIDEGVTLEMEKLPLSNLERLEFANGTTIVLPYEDGNFYQVIPIASSMVVEGDLTVKIKAQEEAEIIAEHTETGTIFQSGTLLEWVSEGGTWTLDQTLKPWRKNGKPVAFDPSERAYFPDIEGGVAQISVATSIESPFTCFANKTTEYTLTRSTTAPDATLTFDSLVIGGWTHFALPLTFHTRLYVAGGDFEGDAIISPVVEIAAGGVFEADAVGNKNATPCLVTVAEGGRFTLAGSHKMKLVLGNGAYLKAENDKHLDWNETTEITWPEDGSKVKIDVSEWTPSETPTPIISGVGYNWTMQDLRKLEVEGNTCSLAVVEGALCLVKSDGIASPYAMSVNSATLNWDDAAWSGNGTAFPKKWSESFLDWTADGVITVNTDNAILTLSREAHFNSLTFVAGNDSVKNLTFTIAEGGELKVSELHLEGIKVATLNNVELEEGILYPAAETHIYGTSSGSLMVGASDKVYIYEPSEKWVLCEGSQGAIYVVVTDQVKASRQKVLTISEDSMWPIGGLDMQIFNPNGSTDNFFISREGEFVYLVPPAIHASVPTGETNWTELTWRAYDESEVTIENWGDVYAARIEAAVEGAMVIVDACPTAELTIGPASGSDAKALVLKASNSGALLPKALTVNCNATVVGDILPTFDYITGPGKLTLDTGSTTTITLNSNFSPIEDGRVEVSSGSRFVIHHTQYFSSTTANWSGLTGDGEVEIVGDNNFRFMMPVAGKMFSKSLSLIIHSELELQGDHKNNPADVSNLSGAGIIGFGEMTSAKMMQILTNLMNSGNSQAMDAFKSQYCGQRALRTYQTKVSEWDGMLSNWFGFDGFGIKIDCKLVVAGEDNAAPSSNRRLIYSGTSSRASGGGGSNPYFGGDHTLEIESSGCLELNGYWNGSIINNGLLIMGHNGSVNGGSSLSGSGYVTMDGEVIDLIACPDIAKYKLYSGTSGTIRFSVESFNTKTTVIPLQAGFTLGDEPLTMIAIDANGDRQWKQVTTDDIDSGNLVWSGAGAEVAPVVLNLPAGDSNFDTLIGSTYLGGVSSITFNGNEAQASQVQITDAFRLFTGELTLTGGATLNGMAPSIATLKSNPVGKIVFVVSDVNLERDLLYVESGFTCNPNDFTIEVVGPNGEKNEMGTWNTSGNKLVYKIADINQPTTGFKFNGTYEVWGSHPFTVPGNPNLDVFTPTRNGYGVKAEKANEYANDSRKFYLGGNDWSFAWCARLGTNTGAVHFSIGDGSEGVALVTKDANHVEIARWKPGSTEFRIIEAEVMAATERFYSYVLTHRKGVYSLYVNGEFVGSANEITDANPLPESVRWQFFNIIGGNRATTQISKDGVLDDVRAYDYVLTEAAIKALAAEFPAWPDSIVTKEGEEREFDVRDLGSEELGYGVYLSGAGTLRLVGEGEAKLGQIADTAKLVIADGVTVRVAMSSGNLEPLKGHEVVVEHGGRLVFEHSEALSELKDCDLSNIMGEGTIEFKGLTSSASIYPPATSFAETLSLCNNTTIYLDGRYGSADTPFMVRNLSGAGTFRYDAPSKAKYIQATQTERTTFTGAFPLCGNVAGNITLTITSLGENADIRNALTLTPSNPQKLVNVIVKTNGCLGLEKNSALGGSMGTTIDDQGLVVFMPPSNTSVALNSYDFKNSSTSTIALNGNGTLVIPLESRHILASSPVGIIDVSGSENASGVLRLIHVVEDFEFSLATFRVAGALDGKDLSVAEGWLCAAAKATGGGTTWATESGRWTASGFNNGDGVSSGAEVSFADAVSLVTGKMVSEVEVTVNDAVAANKMSFTSVQTDYTFTGSGSIDCATIEFAANCGAVNLNGVSLMAPSIEIIAPSSVAAGTKLIGWTNKPSNGFTSTALDLAGLILESRNDGLYVVEKSADLEDGLLYSFNTDNLTYDVSSLSVSPSPMTIACSLKTESANTMLWEETGIIGGTMKIGLATGSSATKIKLVNVIGSATGTLCDEVEVPFANQQTHTYIVTFNVISGSTGQWVLYVDGVKVGESSVNEYAFLYNKDTYKYSHAQNVEVQDGRIYSRVLNASEIKAYVKEFPKAPSLRRPPRILVR